MHSRDVKSKPSVTFEAKELGKKTPVQPPVQKPAVPPSPAGRPPGLAHPAASAPAKQKTPAGAVAGGVAVGAGMAAAELGVEMRAKLDHLQSQFSSAQQEMHLTSAQRGMSEMHSTLALLPTELENLRRRGYVFRNFLENKIGVLVKQWDEMQARVSTEISRRAQELTFDANEAENLLRQAMSGNPTQVARAESAVSSFENKVRAARSAVEAMYEPLRQNVNQTHKQVEEMRWLLDQIDEATFRLYPAECPIMACKAQYLQRENEGPQGLLYLTDERVIFERKEEVATKKVLFITTAKETVRETIFAVPIGQVEEAKASDEKKFLGRKEMLRLLFAPEADLSEATLRLVDAENEEWARMIGRVKSGEIDKERTQPKDQAVVEAAQAAPTKCPTCGATLSTPIVRGMKELTCEYCGSVIRL